MVQPHCIEVSGLTAPILTTGLPGRRLRSGPGAPSFRVTELGVLSGAACVLPGLQSRLVPAHWRVGLGVDMFKGVMAHSPIAREEQASTESGCSDL